jgi:hypothetical protein
VTLSHEPVPALDWPAMTMTFALANPGIARGFKAGDRVRFGFDRPRRDRRCGIWRRWRASDRPSHPLVGEEPLLRRARHARAGRRGLWAVRSTPIDALPDLSDVQVVIRTSYPGQAPQIVENQITYPLTTTMLSVPGAKTVRGYSFFGDSFVYVIFEDGTDLYWARRVLEYLNQVQGRLPGTAARSGRTRPGSAGSMNMRWSTAPAGTISRSFAGCRTGSCATS